jgi:hypothetical protein
VQWETPEPANDGALKIPPTWLHLHYYEAFNVLFRVENALRLFVYVILKCEYRSKWLDLAIRSDDGEGTIASVAARRRNQATNFAYLGFPISSPMLYLTTGELLRVITSDAYWKLFSRYFPGAKNVVTVKFDELTSIRNALAHFRPVKEDDVASLKQLSKQLFSTVESVLNDLMTCRDTVPTNNTAEWYAILRTLGTSVCGLSFHQGSDGSWVRLDMAYGCPILRRANQGDRFHSFTVLTVSASAILREYPELRSYVIYASEDVPWVPVTMEGRADFKKRLSFAFSQAVLATAGATVRSELEAVLKAITDETELIQEDNLARGKLVRTAQPHVLIRENLNSGPADTSSLYSPLQEGDPPEWWGEIETWGSSHVMSSMNKYPWMPGDISSVDFPF